MSWGEIGELKIVGSDVYLTSIGKFLPGPPISNDEMEDHLGRINGKGSRSKPIVLRQNNIKKRHYAIDRDGNHLYTNAQLAANACRAAIDRSEVRFTDIDYLATATTQGDLLVPGFASSVHAELGLPPLEIANFQSVCASSIMALKSAYLQIKAGERGHALMCASEFASRWFRPGFYQDFYQKRGADAPLLEAEFLRWTLSDGAGAALLEPKPNEHGRSLRIEWIDLCSFADRFDNCMYAGTASNDPLTYKPWGHYSEPKEAIDDGAIMLVQDFRILYDLFPVWLGHYLKLIEQGKIVIDEIDHFLGHYSAHSLRIEMTKLLQKAGAMIPEEKWFTNLYSKGNTGSAAILIMLEELFNERKLKREEKIVCFVPESGRCIVSFMLLTVV